MRAQNKLISLADVHQKNEGKHRVEGWVHFVFPSAVYDWDWKGSAYTAKQCAGMSVCISDAQDPDCWSVARAEAGETLGKGLISLTANECAGI